MCEKKPVSGELAKYIPDLWCLDMGSLSYVTSPVMGDRLNFIINHQLESIDAFDVVLPIIIGSIRFTK